MNTYRIYYKENGRVHDYGIFKGTLREAEAKIARLNARFPSRKFYWTA